MAGTIKVAGKTQIGGATTTDCGKNLLAAGVPRDLIIKVANGDHPDFPRWAAFIRGRHGDELYGDVLNEYAHLYDIVVPDIYIGTRAERHAKQVRARMDRDNEATLRRTAANLRYKTEQRAKNKGGNNRRSKPVEINKRAPGRIFITKK